MVLALFHEPFRSAGGSADAYGTGTDKPLTVNLVGTFNLVASGVDAEALVEQHPSVGTLAAADEEDDVVACSKGGDAGHTVGHLSADGVETTEGGIGRDVRLDIFHDALKLVEALRGLRIEIDVVVEVEAAGIVNILDDRSMTGCLSDKSEHLGMTVFAEDDDINGNGNGSGFAVAICAQILALDAFLQLQHHGTGGIDNLDIVSACRLVGLGRFAMGTEQDTHVVQLRKLLVVDGNETQPTQTLTLYGIVHNIAQTIERATLGQLLFGLLDGCGHAEAETAAFVNLYKQIHFNHS